MNSKNLFEKLSRTAPEKAQIVGRNILSRNPDDMDFAETYLNFCIAQIDSPMKEVSDFFIGESERILQLISDSCEMTEAHLQKIESYSALISEQENHAQEAARISCEKENDTLLENIKEEYFFLKRATDRKSVLNRIESFDAQIVKEMLSPNQLASYQKLAKLIADDVAENARRESREKNMKALQILKSALDTFNSDGKYKKEEAQLKYIAVNYLCSYDVNTLDPEVAMYYNHVYNYIFSKVKDSLKFKWVEFIVSNKKR